MDVESVFDLSTRVLKVLNKLGVISLEYNEVTQTFDPISNKRDKLKRLLVFCITFSLKCAIIFSLIQESSHLRLAQTGDSFRIAFGCIVILSIGLDLHCVLKWEENRLLLNSQYVTCKSFAKRFGRTDIAARTSKAEKAIMQIITSMRGGMILASLLCTIHPKFYVFRFLLPNILAQDTVGIPWTAFMVMTQFLTIFYVNASLVFHTVLGVISSVLRTEILHELNVEEELAWTIPELRETQNSLTLFGTSKICMNLINESLLQDIYPFGIAWYTSFIVFSLAVLIKIDLPFGLQCTFVIAVCQVGVLLYCFVVIPSLLVVDSTTYSESLRLKCVSRGKWLSKVQRSLAPCRIYIGPFTTLDISVFTSIVSIIIENTVDVILAIDLEDV